MGNLDTKMGIRTDNIVRVLLINQGKIPHYRVPVYNYLGSYLEKKGFRVTVVSAGIQEGISDSATFSAIVLPLNSLNLIKTILKADPQVVIFWVNLKYKYLFPVIVFTKAIGKKALYWGHGKDLMDIGASLKNLAYATEHWICDAIILYAEHLKKYIMKKFHYKVFIANNTLNLTSINTESFAKEMTLSKYNIKTKKNIICMGRMQKRKRLEDLFSAFKILDDPGIGLILVGPDTDGLLNEIDGSNIYKLGPIYGDERFALLSASDVYCLPGAVGLSIVDAFYCGLPIVTEEGDESPEIMYLQDRVNGFIVPKGDATQLALKLKLLLNNDLLRTKFSKAARDEIITKGNMDVMCKGFEDALRYVSKN
jgi:glycosyltransferase involved in cell wall biosynthesis